MLLNVNAATFLEYDLGLKYIFDSNIAQNTTETSKHYFVPGAYLKLYPFSAADLFISTEIIYDCYLKERDADDNSPFVTGGLGIDLGKKKIRVTPEFYIEQYFMANGYSLNNDGEFEEKDSWVSFLRTYNFKTSFLRKKKKVGIYANAEVGYRDYDQKNEKEGVELKLEPEVRYFFKGKDKKVGFKSFRAAIEYSGQFTETGSNSYNRVMVTVKTDVRLWRAKLDVAVECGRKIYIGTIEHPHSGDEINETIKYLNFKPSINVDVIADLELNAGSTIRLRKSNYPNEEYYRYTLFAGVSWDSKIKRKKK